MRYFRQICISLCDLREEKKRTLLIITLEYPLNETIMISEDLLTLFIDLALFKTAGIGLFENQYNAHQFFCYVRPLPTDRKMRKNMFGSFAGYHYVILLRMVRCVAG